MPCGLSLVAQKLTPQGLDLSLEDLLVDTKAIRVLAQLHQTLLGAQVVAAELYIGVEHLRLAALGLLHALAEPPDPIILVVHRLECCAQGQLHGHSFIGILQAIALKHSFCQTSIKACSLRHELGFTPQKALEIQVLQKHLLGAGEHD